MPEDEKNPVEKAMEKDCIIILAAMIIKGSSGKAKCRGPDCGQWNIFASKCGFSR